MKEALRKIWEHLTCKHVYGTRVYVGWVYTSNVDAASDVRTHVYLETCAKCGKTHIVRTYHEPVEPENKKR